MNPLELSVDDIGAKVHEYGGIVIPAHVDRFAFSMVSQLGVITRGPWAALECTRIPPVIGPPMGKGQVLDTMDYHLITSSDAHYSEYVGRRSFELEINMEELAPNGLSGGADMNALKRALEKRPIMQETKNKEQR